MSKQFGSKPNLLVAVLRWDVSGAVIGTECGTLESGSSIVFLREGERKLCTPYMDTTGYGNLRFYFSMGEYIPLSYLLCSPFVTGDE